jgi:anti-sigma regulatory factor (Ser/Thr protein kinase)
MRTGAAAGHRGYLHEAVYYSSEDELLDVAVPFLQGGLAAGEPTVVSLGEQNAALVRKALPDQPDLVFLAGGTLYARPAAAIRSYREMLASYLTQGAHQIRIIGEVTPAALGVTWESWARYESAINHAYDDFPLWSMCAYDTRRTPGHVLADVARTHPSVAMPGGRHEPGDSYADPTDFLVEWRRVPDDPIQHMEPTIELTDPTPATARTAVAQADRGLLPPGEVEDLVLAVSEVVTNAWRHGSPPVRLRVWVGTDRIVVAVSDRGRGPTYPFAGLIPTGDGAGGGLGLWLAHQLCNHVTSTHDGDAFTVRLTAGNPHVEAARHP